MKRAVAERATDMLGRLCPCLQIPRAATDDFLPDRVQFCVFAAPSESRRWCAERRRVPHQGVVADLRSDHAIPLVRQPDRM